MDEIRILYIDEKSELEKKHIHIYGVRVVNDYINVRVYSDCKVLEMYINGRLCSRQKGSEVFDFYEPCSVCGNAEIRVVGTDRPDIVQNVNVVI